MVDIEILLSMDAVVPVVLTVSLVEMVPVYSMSTNLNIKTKRNNRGNVRINVILRPIRATIVAVGKQ